MYVKSSEGHRAEHRSVRPYPAQTAVDAPFATMDIDLSVSKAAQDDYACYGFSERRQPSRPVLWSGACAHTGFEPVLPP